MTDALHRWHIVIVDPQREITAGEALKERGFNSYVPRIAKIQKAGRGRTRVVSRAMFSCYGLINLESGSEAWNLVRAVTGVRNFLSIDGRPASLPDSAVDAIRATEALIEQERCRKFERPPAFAIDQAVIVSVGPWSELSGRIERLDDRGRVQVLLDMEFLGRRSMPVDPWKIKAVG